MFPMPIENIGFTLANTLPGPQAASEPGATPAPLQPKNDAKVGSQTSSLPQLLQAKAPARPALPTQDGADPLKLAQETQSELAAMNLIAQAHAEALSTGLEGTRELLQAAKEAAKDLRESARKH